MRRKYTIFLIGCLLSLFLGSCRQDDSGMPPRRVVVIHSEFEDGLEGDYFCQLMEQKFKEAGVKVIVHHLYLDLVQEPLDYNLKHYLQEDTDSLLKWNPEVILLNEDYALNWWLHITKINQELTSNDKLAIRLRHIPTVMAGITTLDKDLYNQYSNLTGFEEVEDLPENLKIYRQVTGSQKVTIELDHEALDDRLRDLCYGQISGNASFINNGDFHVKDLKDSYLEKQFPGKLLVNFVSVSDPETNRDYTEDEPEENERASLDNRQRGITYFRECMDQCKHHAGQLQVKHDIYSNTFITHSLCPQFSCIRQQFNEAGHNIAAGYFSSLETQIEDQVSYAVKILQGASPKSLALGQHEKGYYMDYLAMRKMEPTPLNYQDYEEQFEIVNAPFHVRRPILFAILLLSFLGLLIFGISRLVQIITLRYHKAGRDYQQELEKEDERRELTLASADAHLFEVKQDRLQTNPYTKDVAGFTFKEIPLKEFEKYVLPESKVSFSALLHYAEREGRNKIRLHITWDGTPENTHWYEITYQISKEDIARHSFLGISNLIDSIVETENKLNDIQEQINESDQKQNFLNNISHDLRTPLNAVTGFAQLISSSELEFSPEELKEFNSAVKENSDMMQSMIASVIEKTQNDHTTKEKIKPLKSSATQFVKRVYQTHQILVPSHLELRLELDEPDCPVYIDPNLTRQVLNNFVGNAFKFTPQGSITIGWKYLAETREVLFYCKDTGIGLNEKDREQVFERFYKASEQANGTGLGLNISKQIVEQQGGTIGVESKLGEGSTFWIKLKEYEGD